MAKRMIKEVTRNPKSSAKTEKRTPATGNADSLYLDRDEVLKSMMALNRKSKGKGRESSQSGSEQSSGEHANTTDEEENTLKQGRENGETDGDRVLDDWSDAESSTSALRRIAASRLPPPARINGDKPSMKVTQPPSRVQAVSSKPVTKEHADPPFSAKPPSASTFESLGLSQPLIAALNGISIRDPTEIQSACIPAILQGRDCIGGAKTGSGKTLAFALPIVERISRDPYGIWGLVLTPTRELAYQLAEQFLAVGKPLGLKTITVVGGMDMMTQAAELEARPHIVVATPGRLCDLLRSNSTGQSKLGRVQVLVLDEADRLLTPTFAPELSYLFAQMPPKRQTCLFTATISDAIMQLAQKPPQPGKQKPFVYRMESYSKTVAGLKQKYLFIPSQVRDPYLIYLLQHPLSEIDAVLRAPTKRKKEENLSTHKRSRKRRQASESETDDEAGQIPSTIIFTQRCATAHLLHHLLEQLDIPSVPLHSHLTQPQRLESLARFRAQQVPILVTTDVGSRGLDIPQVAMVINWDCPRRSDDYVHRVGRTARAGRGGVAVTVVTEKDVDLVKMIEEEVGVKMTELELPEEEVLEGLNAVSLARRMATMEMHDTGFGERQATNKAKAIRRAKKAKVG